MTATSLVSVAGRLLTSFRANREYLDGVVVERNAGELAHNTAQGDHHWLRSRLKKPGIWADPEQRVQMKPSHFRAPDICGVTSLKPCEAALTTPPVLGMEILSKDDRAGETQEKIEDYPAFGIPCVWAVDPERRRGCLHTGGGSHKAKDRILRTENPDIAVPPADIFAEP